jgi:hypothetical protein
LCVPKTSSASRDQAIFAYQATDASLSSDAVLLKISRFKQRFQRRGAVQGAVRPVLVVVGLVLAQDPPQMALVPDEGSVQELAPASADPVGLEYSIAAVTCFFSEQREAVMRRSGTRG